MTAATSVERTGSPVMVAMSGGVDSSVAAAMLRDAGHEVVGVTLRLWGGERGERGGTELRPNSNNGQQRHQMCTKLVQAQVVVM